MSVRCLLHCSMHALYMTDVPVHTVPVAINE